MPIPRLFLFLSLIVIASTTACAAFGHRGMVGGYSPITNLNDEHLIKVAKFAVIEYNQKNGTGLEFVKIVKGESQVVAGTNYRLVIAAKDAGAVHNYQAVIYERTWQKYMSLTSFTPL